MKYNPKKQLPSFSFYIFNLLIVACVSSSTTGVAWGQRILARETSKQPAVQADLGTAIRPIVQVVRRPVYQPTAPSAQLPPWRSASPTSANRPLIVSPTLPLTTTPNNVQGLPVVGNGQPNGVAALPSSSPVPNLSSGNGKWYPYVIARGSDRDRIKELPIEQRPNRPLHFYGNTVRRNLNRQSNGRPFSRR